MNKFDKKIENAPVVDNSVPYPEAPEVDHNDPKQEHYRGARDPEKALKRPNRDYSTSERPYR